MTIIVEAMTTPRYDNDSDNIDNDSDNIDDDSDDDDDDDDCGDHAAVKDDDVYDNTGI
jgi:hypothetical protein